MNAGRVEQISPPRELYTRPSSLFVARFIGANTLISGTVRSTAAGKVEVQSAFGPLAALEHAVPVAPGATVSIVLPAEAMHVLPGTMPEAEARAIHGANVIRCQINRLQLVGHIMQIALTLPNGDSVALEGHVDKYRGLLVAGEPGYVAWSPEDATLIVG
jgi:putative spermidine/putrescine transport system ATP-binding protein/spermidine/putrescine transport system ATP-binding protein